jgi:murein L,D-transpeptidase YafK
LPSLFLVVGLAAAFESPAMAFLPDFVRDKPSAELMERERIDYARLLADKVVVKKSERRLYLIKDNKPVMSYPVSLGFSPEGHKERQGDGRTPEGRYFLDWRNPNSKFRRSLHISYPNDRDRLRARRKGVDPGGLIMIHGQPRPNQHAELQQLIAREDWTEGCIAVPNYAIDEIWEKTVDGTPIDILP